MESKHAAPSTAGHHSQSSTTHKHKDPAAQGHCSNQGPTATDYKQAGNKLCSVHRYEEAINCYAKAIELDPEVAIFHSNKALCHLKLSQYQRAIQDCRHALELDPNLIKAHLFLGQALAEIDELDDALKHLQRAHELAKDRQLNFGDDMTYLIRLTKRRRWSKIEHDESKLEEELRNYLVDLINKDREAKLKQLTSGPRTNHGEGSSSQQVDLGREPSEQLAEGHSITAGTSNEEADLERQRADFISNCDTYINKLDAMFNQLSLQRKKREVPDHLCGKISFEIMHDPVITPSGITYDRQDIEDHLQRVGHFDPVTRQPLTSSQLISNLAMKEVIDAYLSENEWANHY